MASWLIRSVLPPVQRGGRVLEHRNQTAYRFSRFPECCMAVRYPTMSFVLSPKTDQYETDGRKNAALLSGR